uniref:Uncharacterized protein n=1 Tax=Arundo donax TaxID=35708 RepID=A0A0A8Z164_ARUDO
MPWRPCQYSKHHSFLIGDNFLHRKVIMVSISLCGISALI